MMTLAIDPGHIGGAVLLDPTGRRVLLAWAWARSERIGGTVYRLRRQHGTTIEPATLHDVGERIRKDMAQLCPEYHLVVEGLFCPAQGEHEELHKYLGRVSRVIELAQAAALVYGPLLSEAAQVDRPLASQWRPEVLQLSGSCSSDLAEERAMAALSGDRPLVVGLGELAHDPHVAEAACQAVWGHRLRHPQQQGFAFGGVQ